MAKKRTKKQTREALDRVLAVVKAESDRYLSPYDIACWILYACDKSDALMFLKGEAEGVHPGDEEEFDAGLATMEDELEEKKNLWLDDSDEAFGIIEDEKQLGRKYDPGYNKPILQQPDMLDELSRPLSDREAESAQVLRAVVDNAIDSSRRAARKRVK